MTCKIGTLCTEECGGERVAKYVCPDGSELLLYEDSLLPYEGDLADLFVCVACQPAIALAKTITSGPGPYMEGDSIDYAFAVTNTGNVDLTGVMVSDPLFAVLGGPIALAVGASDTTTFTGSYTVTAADVQAGVVNNTASVQGTSPQNETVTDEDSASAPAQGPQLVKRCAVLPEIQLDRFLVTPSNLQTNKNGDSYYTSSTYEFRSPGGVVLGVGESTATANNYDDLTLESNNPVTTDLGVVTGVHPASWIGDTVFWTTPDDSSSPPNPVTWNMESTSGPGPSDGSVQGCESSFRTEFAFHDVDQGSTLDDLSRPWDAEIDTWEPSSGPYTDNGDGSFTFPQGSGGNWYLYWNTPSRTDSVSFTYIQETADGTVQTHRMFWTPAVCVMEDADGNIVSAETIDGPLDPARYNELTFL